MCIPIRTRSSASSGHACACSAQLRIRCRRRRVAGAREDVEEGVALRVDLLAAVPRERIAHEPPVVLQRRRIPVAQLSDESRRPLHVREQEGDGADAGFGHDYQ